MTPDRTAEPVSMGLVSKMGLIFKRLRQSVMVIFGFNSPDTSPPDEVKLLLDLQENENVIRDNIRWAAGLFRDSQTEEERNSAYFEMASLLKSVADSDLNSEIPISLNAKELRIVLDGLQEVWSAGPLSLIAHTIESETISDIWIGRR